MLKRVFLLLVIFLNINLVLGNNFYADLEIDVLDNGLVFIDGDTNHPELSNVTSSSKFTSKNQEFWVLNITTDEVFDNFSYILNLPKGVEINYIRTTPKVKFEDTDESISILGQGENQKFRILIQYKINNNSEDNKNSQILNGIIFVLFVFVLVLSLFLVYKFKFKSKKHKEILNKTLKKDLKENLDKQVEVDLIDNKVDNVEVSFKNLSERQKQIIDIVTDNVRISQKQLVEILDIPKSSVSRNVNSLVNKNILDKEKVGLTTYIFLKKQEK